MCYLIGRLAHFAVLGLVAIVAVGPVVGIVGVLLPFAVIGLVAFAGYRLVGRLFGRRRAAIPPLPAVAEPAPHQVAEVEPVREEPARPRRGRVVVEVLCGGLVGGLVAAAVTWQAPELLGTVVPAVVAGAVVGYVVGGTNAERGRPARALDA